MGHQEKNLGLPREARHCRSTSAATTSRPRECLGVPHVLLVQLSRCHIPTFLVTISLFYLACATLRDEASPSPHSEFRRGGSDSSAGGEFGVSLTDGLHTFLQHTHSSQRVAPISISFEPSAIRGKDGRVAVQSCQGVLGVHTDSGAVNVKRKCSV